jgi:hypothetical protein
MHCQWTFHTAGYVCLFTEYFHYNTDTHAHIYAHPHIRLYASGHSSLAHEVLKVLYILELSVQHVELKV